MSRTGFTLIELILVMVIIGILAGAVVINVSGRGNEARITRARHDLSVYRQAVETFALENNDQYPKSLNDLVGGKRDYVMEIRKDPWGNAYVYRIPGKAKKYDLLSRGPDKQEGTADDISVWDE